MQARPAISEPRSLIPLPVRPASARGRSLRARRGGRRGVTDCGPPRPTRSNVRLSPPVVPIGTAKRLAPLASLDDRVGITGRDDIAALILAEQDRGRVGNLLDHGHRHADVAGQRHLGDCDRRAAVRAIVDRSDDARPRSSSRTHSPARFSAARSTGGGAPSRRPWQTSSQSDWPTWLSLNDR